MIRKLLHRKSTIDFWGTIHNLEKMTIMMALTATKAILSNKKLNGSTRNTNRIKTGMSFISILDCLLY